LAIYILNIDDSHLISSSIYILTYFTNIVTMLKLTDMTLFVKSVSFNLLLTQIYY